MLSSTSVLPALGLALIRAGESLQPASPSLSSSATSSATASASASGAPTPSAAPTSSASASASCTAARSPSPRLLPSPALSRRRHCGGLFPLNGTWRDPDGTLAPPYFFPDASECEAAAVPTEAMLRKCLADRGGGRLFFMGNSFARGTAFALQAFLASARGGGGAADAPPAREEQIRMCPKHIDFNNPLTYSCELLLQDPAARAAEVAAAANASAVPPPPLVARVLWRHFWASGLPALASGADRDFCSGQPSWEVCYAAFFGDRSGTGDVLFTNIGRGYAEAAARSGSNFFDSATLRGVADDASAFLASRVFNGTVVWTTQTVADSNHATWASFNPHMEALNSVVPPLLRERGVVVVDQASFWKRGVRHRADMWVDGIHPPQEGYLAAFFLGMSALCELENL